MSQSENSRDAKCASSVFVDACAHQQSSRRAACTALLEIGPGSIIMCLNTRRSLVQRSACAARLAASAGLQLSLQQGNLAGQHLHQEDVQRKHGVVGALAA